MRTGEALNRLIAAYGIDTVFGIAGVHNVELFRGFAESGLRLVRPRHEQGAGFMADGYARASGRLAACYAITGPGLTNLMTPLAQAQSDHVPILAVASTLQRADLGQRRGRLHEMIDQRGAAAAILDLAVTATASHDVPELVIRALAMQAAGRPRPAYVEIPIDVLASEAEGVWEKRALPGPPQPSGEAVTAAACLLSAAERPFIIAGGGSVAAAPALIELAERLRSPVVTTTAGKGVIADGHMLTLRATLAQPATQALLAAADVVLAVGTELAETDHWLPAALPVNGKLIRIDTDPARFGDAYAAAVPILGDAGAALAALLKGVSTPRDDGASEAEIAAVRHRIRAAEPPLRRCHRGVLEAVRRALPEDAIVASDMTQLAYSANEIFPVSRPRCWFHPAGFGTLGYAVPAAIGAQLACPGRAVAALVGDYGFQFTMNELATAAEHKLPVVVLLWNNRALGQIRDDMVRRGIAPLGTDAPGPDFEALAHAFGCAYRRPRAAKAIETAIAEALPRDRPTIIELVEEAFR